MFRRFSLTRGTNASKTSEHKIVVTFRYAVPPEEEGAYDAEFQLVKTMIGSWFPDVSVIQDKKAFVKHTSHDVTVGDILVHTNLWLKEGKLSEAGAEKQKFVREVIAAARKGESPDVKEYKHLVKKAKSKMEYESMEEANRLGADMKIQILAEKKRKEEWRNQRRAEMAEWRNLQEESLSPSALSTITDSKQEVSIAATPSVPKAKPKAKPKGKPAEKKVVSSTSNTRRSKTNAASNPVRSSVVHSDNIGPDGASPRAVVPAAVHLVVDVKVTAMSEASTAPSEEMAPRAAAAAVYGRPDALDLGARGVRTFYTLSL